MISSILGSKRSIKPIRQSQASECGLACMTMIARYFGHDVDIAYMRAMHPVSRRGMTLANMSELATNIGFDARGFALTSVEDLSKVALPAVLHWDGNHFVVLESIGPKGYQIHDPAFGTRTHAIADMRRHFAGIVLEIEPRMDFRKIKSSGSSQLFSILKVTRGLEGALSQVLIVSLAVSVLGLATPILLQVALDIVLPQLDLDLLTLLTIGLGVFLIFEAGGKWLRDLIILRSSILFQTYFTRNIIGHAFRLPLSYFENRHPGDFVARLDSIENVKTHLVRGLVSSIADSMMSVLAVALMLYYSPSMTAVVVATLVILVALRVLFVPALKNYSTTTLEAHSEERARLLDGLRRVETLKTHNAAERQSGRWYESFVRFVNADFQAKKTELKVEMLLHVLLAISTVGTLYLGVTAVMLSTMSIGMLYAFFALRQTFFERIDNLTTQLMHLSILGVHLKRLDDIVDQTPETSSAAGSMARQLRNSVKLDNITIQFGRGDKPILSGATLSIDVSRNETIAIAGPSGSGKSSLLKVIASLHPPHAGSVEIDGQPLQRFGLREYRDNLGAVFADDGLFAGTVSENLTLFDSEVSLASMETALRDVGLYDDVTSLPQGFATLLSEESTVLSTGQRRRLLVARAICRSPKLYLFDEVSANLDRASEDSLIDGLLAIPGAKIFATHSQRLIERVDRVYVIQNGRLEQVSSGRNKPRPRSGTSVSF